MKVVVAMSGGVDSSVAAALLHAAGHEVVGISRSRANAERLRSTGARAVVADVLDRQNLLDAVRGERADAVIQGAATGQIFQINKTRTTIGRAGQDINLDDPEASRQHAVLEILNDTAILRDLESTNGTFIELERVEQQVLSNQHEFRIGSHVLMFIVTEVE